MNLFKLVDGKNVSIKGEQGTGKTELLKKIVATNAELISDTKIYVYGTNATTDFKDIKNNAACVNVSLYNICTSDIISSIYEVILKRVYDMESERDSLIIVIDDAQDIDKAQLMRLIKTISKLDDSIHFIVGGSGQYSEGVFDENIYTEVKDGEYLVYFKVEE